MHQLRPLSVYYVIINFGEAMQHVDTQRVQTANVVRDTALQSQLVARRERLHTAIKDHGTSEYLVHLLGEVDAALKRMEKGTFGICEICHESIESDRLLVDPLIRNCLDHLSAIEQRALERDLDLAYQIQRGLLPKPEISVNGWSVAYHYEPAGPVSGDYCDIIVPENERGTLYFLVGDVTGKGVAASLLMAHLHAIFRSLTTANLSMQELVQKANRIFCEGTLSTYFATLVAGKAGSNGRIEISNAGHCLPLHARPGTVERIPPNGLPLGLFCDSEYTSHLITLAPGESLVLYSDGITESRNGREELYGEERLAAFLGKAYHKESRSLLASVLDDASAFRAGAPRADDITMMVIRREK
jgi:sigma-B regulation protein RsbU (phosphoserine phosphatase)